MNPETARILVVEDDEILRDTLVEVMADEGHEVRPASNGREALDALDAWTPHLIVLDLMMPHMDAYEFRKHQLERGLAADARILILSAARDLERAAAVIGADACIGKPFRLLEVIEAVDRLVHDRAA